MVAVHSVMSESEGKAVMPGVGFIMMSMSSFWSLAVVSACAQKVSRGQGVEGLIKMIWKGLAYR